VRPPSVLSVVSVFDRARSVARPLPYGSPLAIVLRAMRVAAVDLRVNPRPELAWKEVHGDAGPIGLVILGKLDAFLVGGLPVSRLRVGDAHIAVRVRIRIAGEIILQIVRMGLDPVPFLAAGAPLPALGPVLAAQGAGVLVALELGHTPGDTGGVEAAGVIPVVGLLLVAGRVGPALDQVEIPIVALHHPAVHPHGDVAGRELRPVRAGRALLVQRLKIGRLAVLEVTGVEVRLCGSIPPPPQWH